MAIMAINQVWWLALNLMISIKIGEWLGIHFGTDTIELWSKKFMVKFTMWPLQRSQPVCRLLPLVIWADPFVRHFVRQMSHRVVLSESHLEMYTSMQLLRVWRVCGINIWTRASLINDASCSVSAHSFILFAVSHCCHVSLLSRAARSDHVTTAARVCSINRPNETTYNKLNYELTTWYQLHRCSFYDTSLFYHLSFFS